MQANNFAGELCWVSRPWGRMLVYLAFAQRSPEEPDTESVEESDEESEGDEPDEPEAEPEEDEPEEESVEESDEESEEEDEETDVESVVGEGAELGAEPTESDYDTVHNDWIAGSWEAQIDDGWNDWYLNSGFKPEYPGNIWKDAQAIDGDNTTNDDSFDDTIPVALSELD